ncbi:MAG: hypothetical protein KBC22_01845 [Candidatus Pacebacteria bacterium]|nr:hypothetical protein [Candidatus Paceibacterota bacterium]
MDNDFQTTFIPKKPIGEQMAPQPAKRANPSVGIFTMLATLLFVVAIIAAGGIYFYERLLAGNIDAMKTSLAAAEGRIEQSFIVELQDLDKRLRNSNQLLAQHLALSPFFRYIEEATLKSVQYDSFDFSFEEGRPVATITGRARQYRSIAEQSIIFGESTLVENHVFSNFTLTQQGQVSFNLKLIPANDLIYFEKSLGRTTDTTFIPTATTTTTPVIPTNVTSTPVEIPTEGTATPLESASLPVNLYHG